MRAGPSIALTALALAAVAASAALADTRAVIVAICAAFLPYAALLVVPVDARAHRLALLLAGVVGLGMVAAPSPLSEDVHRYLWDGRQWLAGHDAYALSPDHPARWEMRDDSWANINHRHIPTVYPPLAQAMFALAALVFTHIASLKWLALCAHLATAWLLPQLAHASGKSEHATRAGVLFALNPLLLQEAALGGHIDAATALCVCALVRCLARGRGAMAAVYVVAAAGLKLLGIVLAPLLWVRHRRLAVLALLGALLCLWPVLRSGHGQADTASGLAHYSQRWRGNEGPFRALEWLATPAVDWVATGRLGEDEVRLGFLAPLLPKLGPSVFAQARKQPRDPTIMPRTQVRFVLARGLSILILFGVLAWCVRRRSSPLSAARAVLWSLLLFSPQIHPWYLAWLLPLDLAVGGRAGLLWTATIMTAYAPLPAWQADRVWIAHTHAHVITYAPVLVALLLEQVRESQRQTTCRPALTACDPSE